MNREPFEIVARLSSTLDSDLAKGDISYEEWVASVDAVFAALGWTQEEFVKEIDRRWGDIAGRVFS